MPELKFDGIQFTARVLLAQEGGQFGQRPRESLVGGADRILVVRQFTAMGVRNYEEMLERSRYLNANLQQ